MSEVHEFIEELTERYRVWQWQRRSQHTASAFDATLDVPEIEFTPLDPFAPPALSTPRVFANMTPAWLATQGEPEVLAQGKLCYERKQVTRVHAHGPRMTGTTYDGQYDDQEIFLREGTLSATCTCRKGTPMPPDKNTETAGDSTARTLPCRHVVAILLAYLQTSAPPNRDGGPSAPANGSGKLVCPVTRQLLQPKEPLFQCSQCGICYSAEGWKFLRQAARGQCCGCESRNTVKEITPRS